LSVSTVQTGPQPGDADPQPILPPNGPPDSLPRRRRLTADLVCLLGLLGFALLVAAPILTGGVPVAMDTLSLWEPQATLAPAAVHNPGLSDSALLYYPWQQFIRASLAGGEWPLWNPDIFAGYPFQGNPQTQLYYPVAWLLWLLPLPAAIQVSTILHVWLAGAGMYLLARLLGASRGGSLIAGLAFAGSGQLYTALEITGVADIYVWLPWVVAATEMAWRRRSWPWTAGAGLLFGVLAVAGHLQWFIYSSIFLAGWLGGHVLVAAWAARSRPGPGVWRRWGADALRAGAILAAGPALGAIQILPVLELAGYANRTGVAGLVGPDQIDRTVRLLARQVHLFVPQFQGDTVGHVGAPLSFNTCWYIGLAPMALAVVAPALRRERPVWFLGAMALAGFGMAAELPLFNQVHRLPVLQAQLPGRAGYLFIFSAAALSALGFDALLAAARHRPRAARKAAALLVACVAVVIATLLIRHELAAGTPLYQVQNAAMAQAAVLAGVLGLWVAVVLIVRGRGYAWGPLVLGGLVLGLTVIDLLTYGPSYNTYVPAAALHVDAPGADLLKRDPDPWRVISVDAPNALFPPNTALLYGLHDVAGYDSLHLTRYEQFWAAADPHLGQSGYTNYFNAIFRPQSYQVAQADLLNARYIAARTPLAATTGSRAPLPAPIYSQEMTIYRNPDALPRAFVVAGTEVMPAAAMPARIAAPDFDPRRAVLLEQAPPPGVPTGPGDGTVPGTATITRYRNLSVDITARMDRPGWLVLGDVNYPGWQVTVDGRPAPLYTAYYILRAVPLPAGAHMVRFEFRPGSVLLGGAISGTALLAALGVLVYAGLHRIRAGRPRPVA
jgi:membrane protein YfhO